MEFKVEKSYKADFEKLLASTCKKFKVEYTLTWSEEMVIGSRRVIEEQANFFPMNSFMPNHSERRFDIIGFVATVEVPEIAKMEETGFKYLGCIKNDELVTVHPTAYAQEKEFQLTSMKAEIETFPCAECGKKIVRKIIHVFESPEGEIAVYGSGCAVKKFGIDFSRVMDKFYETITIIEESYGDDDYFGGGSYGPNLFDGSEFSFIAFYNIYKYGYISGTKAYNEDYRSTKDSVVDDIYYIHNNKIDTVEKKSFIKELNTFGETSKLKWDEFIAWIPSFKNTLSDDDFGFNMTAVCDMFSNNAVAPRMAGYAVYVVFRYWQDALAPKEPKIEFNTDYSHLKVGDKVKKFGPLTVEIIGLFTRESQYGTTFIYTFREVNTNIKYKWFATNVELDDSKRHEIWSGTIKEFQDDAKYGKAVILTRCRCEEL